MTAARRILALTGGVGGAKLALGLTRILAPDQLSFLVNTGDDFEHLGLTICPDIDTLLYTLSGEANPETGWGRRHETWQCMEALGQLGGDTWFRLGDRDLATHLLRTQALKAGATLTEVTARLADRLGVAPTILPMADERVATIVQTEAGDLAFQHYFVRDRCEPAVTGFRFDGVEAARPSPALLELLKAPDLDGILICPSNPFVSIDPILRIPGLRDALMEARAPVVAVAPIVAGQAIKGPTAKMMAELGVPRQADAVAAHYGDLLDGFIVDVTDTALVPRVEALGVATVAAQTLMLTLHDRINLAQVALDFLDSLQPAR